MSSRVVVLRASKFDLILLYVRDHHSRLHPIRALFSKQRGDCFSGAPTPAVCQIIIDPTDGEASTPITEKAPEQASSSGVGNTSDPDTSLEDFNRRRSDFEQRIWLVKADLDKPPKSGFGVKKWSIKIQLPGSCEGRLNILIAPATAKRIVLELWSQLDIAIDCRLRADRLAPNHHDRVLNLKDRVGTLMPAVLHDFQEAFETLVEEKSPAGHFLETLMQKATQHLNDLANSAGEDFCSSPTARSIRFLHLLVLCALTILAKEDLYFDKDARWKRNDLTPSQGGRLRFVQLGYGLLRRILAEEFDYGNELLEPHFGNVSDQLEGDQAGLLEGYLLTLAEILGCSRLLAAPAQQSTISFLISTMGVFLTGTAWKPSKGTSRDGKRTGGKATSRKPSKTIFKAHAQDVEDLWCLMEQILEQEEHCRDLEADFKLEVFLDAAHQELSEMYDCPQRWFYRKSCICRTPQSQSLHCLHTPAQPSDSPIVPVAASLSDCLIPTGESMPTFLPGECSTLNLNLLQVRKQWSAAQGILFFQGEAAFGTEVTRRIQEAPYLVFGCGPLNQKNAPSYYIAVIPLRVLEYLDYKRYKDLPVTSRTCTRTFCLYILRMEAPSPSEHHFESAGDMLTELMPMLSQQVFPRIFLEKDMPGVVTCNFEGTWSESSSPWAPCACGESEAGEVAEPSSPASCDPFLDDMPIVVVPPQNLSPRANAAAAAPRAKLGPRKQRKNYRERPAGGGTASAREEGNQERAPVCQAGSLTTGLPFSPGTPLEPEAASGPEGAATESTSASTATAPPPAPGLVDFENDDYLSAAGLWRAMGSASLGSLMLEDPRDELSPVEEGSEGSWQPPEATVIDAFAEQQDDLLGIDTGHFAAPLACDENAGFVLRGAPVGQAAGLNAEFILEDFWSGQ